MLAAIGVASFSDLVRDIPEEHRFPNLNLPDSLDELSVAQELSALASKNIDLATHASFLGAGAYRHFIPSTVNAVLQRGEFVTSYTPYQPEASQGVLQSGFEFQTAIAQLLDMDVANAGMYDGPTAFAEAGLMAARVTRRNRILILDSVDPRLIDVANAYSHHQQVNVQVVSRQDILDGAADDSAACIAFQSPNFLGGIEDCQALVDAAHDVGALAVMHTYPISLGLLKPPGAYGVDIATAEGQSLGVSLSYGGAYVGLLTSQNRFIRQLPGRIIGQTIDTDGATGYTLTLQTREQHIRRERATSNICTSTQLIGLMVAVYVATMGPSGIRRAAELSYHKAHYLAQRIDALEGWSLAIDSSGGSAFFNEFPITCPISPSEVNEKLLERGIIGGLDISHIVPDGMLLCVTEMNSREEIDALLTVLESL